LILELNELCPSLLDRFMTAGDLPAFSRLHRESIVCTTDAGEPQGLLNPWIQWVTVHTGLGYADHGVFKLGEGGQQHHETVGDVVTAHGGDVWLCGPMNVVPQRPLSGWWLPDPWNPHDPPQPADLAPIAEFVRANVQEHTNASHRLSVGTYRRFLTAMARHGLSAGTVAATLRQLVGERTGRAERWSRAALLDRFQWDLFVHHWRQARPQLATYFSNTTAHYQHVYWRYMDPGSFKLQPTPEEQNQFGGAVRSGYLEMDRLVGEALDLVGDDTTLVLCTALSQQPYLLKDDEGGNRFHRPHDLADVLERIGVLGVRKVSPVMAAQFHVYFGTEAEAIAAADLLTSATVGDRPALDVRRVGADVFTGIAFTDDVAPGAELRAGREAIPFEAHFYRAETAKSGYHHPHGALWVRAPGGRHAVVEQPVPLRAAAPTLLALLGLPIPASMTEAPIPAVVGTAASA
ncbi:MAG: hypothetical protein OEW24_10115, partial [Chloroflexota bacterium]|nr:hypothetical protein [Chloroflexota bacterium]